MAKRRRSRRETPGGMDERRASASRTNARRRPLLALGDVPTTLREAKMDEAMKERRLSAARAALAQAMKAFECMGSAGEREIERFLRKESSAAEATLQPIDDAFETEQEMVAKPAPDDPETRRRLFVRMTLIQEYRLSSAFIAVPKLAQILGMSPSTIWAHMRQRKFPIPYRMFNTTPMVAIDDLVDWYCERDDLIFPQDEAPPSRKSPADQAREEQQRRDAESDAIVASALASLGLAPKRSRRR